MQIRRLSDKVALLKQQQKELESVLDDMPQMIEESVEDLKLRIKLTMPLFAMYVIMSYNFLQMQP